MQCVILSAGEGTRMRPLTLERPKPLIEVCGMPLIAHIISALPEHVDEVILVIGYKGEMLRDYCGDHFLGRRMHYVVQDDPKGGTADALWAAQDLLTGTFLVMYGDDIHGARALEEVTEKPHAMLTAVSTTPERFGVLDLHPDGTLRAIIEKPEHPPSNLVNIGGFVLGTDIFAYRPERGAQGECLLTDAVTAYAAVHPVIPVKQDVWLPLGYPEDIKKAEAVLCPQGI